MLVPGGVNFDDANLSQSGSEASRRDTEKLTVSPTGPSRTNTQGKGRFVGFVKRNGGNSDNFQLTYKGNQANGLIALYVTKPGDKGVMNVTQYANSITFHLGACFKEFPLLRPGQKVDCHIEESVDAKGVPCIIVHVAAGSPTRTIKRKKDKNNQNQPETPDAPAEE